MMWHCWTDVQIARGGIVSRRSFLRGVVTAGGALGLVNLLAAASEALRRKRRSCILLWMGGGPSQFESFDPKPASETGGGTKTIATTVPGVQIAEYWPRMTQWMNRVTLIRSMVAREANHQRATYHMHTGHLPAGGVVHPSMGSIVVSRAAPEHHELPQFVSIGGATHGAGLFGSDYDPFVMSDPSRPPANLKPTVAERRWHRRLELLRRLRRRRGSLHDDIAAEDHALVQERAVRLVETPHVRAFDVAQEPEATRRRYGATRFGLGCLLARRLVEAGVTFVEVRMSGWDTHRDNFTITPKLAAITDPAFAALLDDLHRRGLWDQTLVIWIGEFGRTPKINPKAGRDHWPQAFSAVLAGGGAPEGAVIGRTSPDGSEVVDHPVTIPDLFATVCRVFDIDPNEEYHSPLGQPIKLVDGGKPIF